MVERVIVGGTSQLAIATARIWAAQKNRINLVGRSADRLAMVAKDLLARGASGVEVTVLDFTHLDRAAADFRGVLSDLPKVESLLISLGSFVPGEELNLSQGDLHQTITDNFHAPAMMLWASRDHFVTMGRGCVAVVTGSPPMQPGYPHLVHSCAKAALSQFVAGHRLELQRYNVRVVEVAPRKLQGPVTKTWNPDGEPWVGAEQLSVQIASAMDHAEGPMVVGSSESSGWWNKLLGQNLFHKNKNR